MTKEKSTVPRLRFPGFTDAWKQRKLREVATFVKGNGYSKKDLVIEGSPIILYGRLYTKYETVISEVDTFVSVEDNKNSVVYSEGGEVLVPASGESSLDIARASVVAKKGIILGGDINIIRLHSEIFPVFLALTISNGKQQKGLSKRAQGKSVVHLHNSDLKKVDLDFPTLPEQEAIGNFFSDLDQLITLHQRKLDDVKELKKALLQKMFPKGNGNDFPELRFPEFKDAWKQRKLGEVADFSIKTNSLSRDKLSSYFYEVQNIHYGDILTKYDAILDVCNKELPSIIGSTISDFADDLLIEGDIVFADAAEDSTVGKAIEVRNFKGKNVVSGLHTIVARPKVSYAPYYLGYLINSTAYHNQILPLMQGTKVSSISKANLKSTTIVFPTLPEQEAIGSFFSDLDQLITLHQRQLDHLKLLKKALLQQMFI
ncbi:TPA: restriction endonuclease subunit S [Streptococcus suis]|nr:restriction endonuclease subunit S [Streptococcus suis]